jgi:hypothetical protein
MEQAFGTTFADVRVHVGSEAPSIGALAFTHGPHVYFAPGQYNPDTASGQQLLRHELTHVVQQRAGRVKSPFVSGIAVIRQHSMELEAVQMSRTGGGSATRFIVDDDTRPGPGQVGRSEFLAVLKSSVAKLANDVLGAIGETAKDCPYIQYWFSRYEHQNAEKLERALEKYAPGALSARDWKECAGIVSARVKEGFLQNVNSGSLAGVPSDVPWGLAARRKFVEQHRVTQMCKRCRCKSCCATDSDPEYVPLDVVSILPPWGTAVALGYHICTPDNWVSIQTSGDFRPSGSGNQLGAGWYLTDDPEAIHGRYATLTIMLEVGYVGGPAAFLRRVKGSGESRADLKNEQDAAAAHAKNDVLETTRGSAQQESCYREDGPHIFRANWRVRKISEYRDGAWRPRRT